VRLAAYTAREGRGVAVKARFNPWVNLLLLSAAACLLAWYQDKVLVVERGKLGRSLEFRRLNYAAQQMVGGGSAACESPAAWSDFMPLKDACSRIAPAELGSDVVLVAEVPPRTEGTVCQDPIHVFGVDGTIYPCCPWLVRLKSTYRHPVPDGEVSVWITLVYPDCESGLEDR
jgi:hypothetical protein